MAKSGGRHWLDTVRYADSNGYERDTDKPDMWRYRDYVIDAFNGDKPYDEFIREQIAGDELDAVTPESIIATGYNRLSIWNDEPDDPLLARYDLATAAKTLTKDVLATRPADLWRYEEVLPVRTRLW